MYGSLYPWHFAPRAFVHNPAWILLHTWRPGTTRFAARDIVVNIVLYVPLGMAGLLAFRSAALALLAGFVLSCTMETLQLFDSTRNASGADVITNVAGTAAGIAAGWVFNRIIGPQMFRTRLRVADRGALLLLFLALGYLLFPFFPHVGLYQPRLKLNAFLQAPVLAVAPFVSAVAVWLAIGHLLTAAGFRRPRLWLAGSLALVPLEFFLVDRQPLPSELAGAICGVALFYLSPSNILAAALFLLSLGLRGLEPFRFNDAPFHFVVVPFGGVLGGEWQSSLRVLVEKAFLYGTAVWLLSKAVRHRWHAAFAVSGLLLMIEFLQIRLPGRTPEITDPVLALMAGFALAGIARERKGRVR